MPPWHFSARYREQTVVALNAVHRLIELRVLNRFPNPEDGAARDVAFTAAKPIVVDRLVHAFSERLERGLRDNGRDAPSRVLATAIEHLPLANSRNSHFCDIRTAQWSTGHRFHSLFKAEGRSLKAIARCPHPDRTVLGYLLATLDVSDRERIVAEALESVSELQGVTPWPAASKQASSSL